VSATPEPWPRWRPGRAPHGGPHGAAWRPIAKIRLDNGGRVTRVQVKHHNGMTSTWNYLHNRGQWRLQGR
jgi:hypothetical protein